ncbi:MAG: hypothetical protein ABIR78_04450, partial [Ferruginibacter sp.]
KFNDSHTTVFNNEKLRKKAAPAINGFKYKIKTAARLIFLLLIGYREIYSCICNRFIFLFIT